MTSAPRSGVYGTGLNAGRRSSSFMPSLMLTTDVAGGFRVRAATSPRSHGSRVTMAAPEPSHGRPWPDSGSRHRSHKARSPGHRPSARQRAAADIENCAATAASDGMTNPNGFATDRPSRRRSAGTRRRWSSRRRACTSVGWAGRRSRRRPAPRHTPTRGRWSGRSSTVCLRLGSRWVSAAHRSSYTTGASSGSCRWETWAALPSRAQRSVRTRMASECREQGDRLGPLACNVSR